MNIFNKPERIHTYFYKHFLVYFYNNKKAKLHTNIGLSILNIILGVYALLKTAIYAICTQSNVLYHSCLLRFAR